MKEKIKKKNKDIAYVFNNKYIIYKNNKFVFVDNLKKTKLPITSRLQIDDYISYSFNLPASTPEEQLYTKIEITMYKEAGLDVNKKYKIIYFKYKQDDNYLIEAIAIDIEKIKQKILPQIKPKKRLEFLAIPFLVFPEYYKLKNIQPKKDGFLYIDENEAFIAIYKDGEYVYSKSLLDFTLNKLAKKTNTKLEDLKSFLSVNGIDKNNPDVNNFFNDLFLRINNILIHIRSLFQIDSLDNLYIYSPTPIKNLESFFSITDIPNIQILPTSNINQFDLLTIYYISNNFDSKYNANVFPKPIPIYKNPYFLITLSFITALSIVGGDYYLRIQEQQQLKQKISSLKSELSYKKKRKRQVQQKIKIIKQTIKDKKVEIKKLQAQFTLLKQYLDELNDILSKSKYSDDFILFSKLASQNLIKFNSITIDNNQYSFDLYVELQNRENIARFLKDLYNNNFKLINITDIVKQNNFYQTTITVGKK